MSPVLRQCPHCGAYVMSDEDICPRCDHTLNVAAVSPDDPPSNESKTVAEPALLDDDSTDLLARPVPTPAHPDEATLAAAPDAASPTGDDPRPPAEPAGSPSGPAELAEPAEQADADAPEASPDPAPEPLPEQAPPSTADVTVARVDVGEPPDAPEVEAPPEMPAVTEATQPRLMQDAGKGDTEPRIAPPTTAPAPEPYTLPPAPYTPPPDPIAPPGAIAPPGMAPPTGYATYQPGYEMVLAQGSAYLQQRVQTYYAGGYRLVTQGHSEASLARGKNLGVVGWLFALPTVIGVLWYLLILAGSGFRRDEVYLTLEADGSVYEDGPGAAHIRLERSRAGRRWGLFGLGLAILCVVAVLILGAAGGIVLTQERYRAALREAYPEFTLFEDSFSDTTADPDDVRLVKDGAVAFSIIAAIVLVGLWGGLTLIVIGVVHARAYHVRVPPLPGYA